MSLWVEIRRRNVFKVGIAYLALAWLIIQVTSMAVPALNLPISLNAIVFYISIIGFPFAIFFAWAFELTPDGIKRAETIDPEKSITAQTGNKLEYAIIGLLVCVVAIFAWEKISPTSEVTATEDQKIAELAPTEIIKEQPSVAVLPFVNMSSDVEQEYFSDGISEEILNVLAKIPGLHVTSRSSAFAFKGKDLDLKDVAEQLGVNHILEGSVRKSGDKVRITAQLIEANSDRHIWSETYDRELVDIFAIQDEISDAIVIVLKEKLMGEHEVPTENLVTSTTSPAAYTAYLKAFQMWQNTGSIEAGFSAIELVKTSIILDDNYAPAHALLALMYQGMTSIAAISQQEGIPLALAEVERSLELDPNYARSYATRAKIKSSFNYDFIGAGEDLKKAISLNPNDAVILRSLSQYWSTMGDFDRALEAAKKAVSLDPMNMESLVAESRVYTFFGVDTKALETANIALMANPTSISLRIYRAYINVNQGNYEDALKDAALIEDDAFKPQLQSIAYYAMGNKTASDEKLQKLITHASDDSAYQIAEVYGYRGEIDKCIEWLEISYDQFDPGLQGILVSQLLKSVRQDPRYFALVAKMGLSK